MSVRQGPHRPAGWGQRRVDDSIHENKTVSSSTRQQHPVTLSCSLPDPLSPVISNENITRDVLGVLGYSPCTTSNEINVPVGTTGTNSSPIRRRFYKAKTPTNSLKDDATSKSSGKFNPPLKSAELVHPRFEGGLGEESCFIVRHQSKIRTNHTDFWQNHIYESQLIKHLG